MSDSVACSRVTREKLRRAGHSRALVHWLATSHRRSSALISLYFNQPALLASTLPTFCDHLARNESVVTCHQTAKMLERSLCIARCPHRIPYSPNCTTNSGYSERKKIPDGWGGIREPRWLNLYECHRTYQQRPWSRACRSFMRTTFCFVERRGAAKVIEATLVIFDKIRV